MKDLSNGLSAKTASQHFIVSKKTIYNAINDKENSLMEIKYKPQVKRVRTDDDQIEHAINFLDEKFPISSGRNYRVITKTKTCLYSLYFKHCEEIGENPVSQSTFLYKILNKLNIHFSDDTTICCYCHKLKQYEVKMMPLTREENAEKEKLGGHVNRWHEQMTYFQKKKREIAQNKNSNWVIIVQDFTQLQVQSTFYQDLIICIYFLDPTASDLLGRKYLHFVAPSSETKNYCRFVFATWKKFIQEEELDKIPFWFVFSDGGPKHFKLTATVNFFGFLQNLLNVNIEYNFFESNHGHSTCDAIVSQAKKKLEQFSKRRGNPHYYSRRNCNCSQTH